MQNSCPDIEPYFLSMRTDMFLLSKPCPNTEKIREKHISLSVDHTRYNKETFSSITKRIRRFSHIFSRRTVCLEIENHLQFWFQCPDTKNLGKEFN